MSGLFSAVVSLASRLASTQIRDISVFSPSLISFPWALMGQYHFWGPGEYVTLLSIVRAHLQSYVCFSCSPLRAAGGATHQATTSGRWAEKDLARLDSSEMNGAWDFPSGPSGQECGDLLPNPLLTADDNNLVDLFSLERNIEQPATNNGH